MKLRTHLPLALVVLVLCAASFVTPSLPAQGKPQPPRGQNGLALTPPMGWNTWNKFACNVDEKLIRTAADQMVSTGMHHAMPTAISRQTRSAFPRASRR
jgi:alpha-galactosidase